MTGESKAWMSPGKTDHVYLLKLQKKQRCKPKSSECIFSFRNIYSKA